MKTSNQNLFNVLHELGLIAIESELQDIVNAVKQDELENQKLEKEEMTSDLLKVLGFQKSDSRRV